MYLALEAFIPLFGFVTEQLSASACLTPQRHQAPDCSQPSSLSSTNKTHLMTKFQSSPTPVMTNFSTLWTPSLNAMNLILAAKEAPGKSGPHLISASSGTSAGALAKCFINICRIAFISLAHLYSRRWTYLDHLGSLIDVEIYVYQSFL